MCLFCQRAIEKISSFPCACTRNHELSSLRLHLQAPSKLQRPGDTFVGREHGIGLHGSSCAPGRIAVSPGMPALRCCCNRSVCRPRFMLPARPPHSSTTLQGPTGLLSQAWTDRPHTHTAGRHRQAALPWPARRPACRRFHLSRRRRLRQTLAASGSCLSRCSSCRPCQRYRRFSRPSSSSSSSSSLTAPLLLYTTASSCRTRVLATRPRPQLQRQQRRALPLGCCLRRTSQAWRYRASHPCPGCLEYRWVEQSGLWRGYSLTLSQPTRPWRSCSAAFESHKLEGRARPCRHHASHPRRLAPLHP